MQRQLQCTHPLGGSVSLQVSWMQVDKRFLRVWIQYVSALCICKGG